jgi:hypothetical protein
MSDVKSSGNVELVTLTCRMIAPHVYFIQAKSGGPIKIGTAENVFRRLRGLQQGNASRLRIVATMPGDRGLEQELHQRFRAFRMHGEWFEPGEELLGFIKTTADMWSPFDEALAPRASALAKWVYEAAKLNGTDPVSYLSDLFNTTLQAREQQGTLFEE